MRSEDANRQRPAAQRVVAELPTFWFVGRPGLHRFLLHGDPVLLGRVRRSVLRTIESGLRRRCPDAPRDARFGAVSFVQRFGSALNAHTHLHCRVTDGVFSLESAGTLHFHPAADLDAAVVSAVQRRIRVRVLRLAVHHGTLTPHVATALARWGHGSGFSLHAAVLIEGSDQLVRYRLTKPLPTGQTASHSGNSQFRRPDYRTQATVTSRARPKHAHSRPSLDRNQRLDVLSLSPRACRVCSPARLPGG